MVNGFSSGTFVDLGKESVDFFALLLYFALGPHSQFAGFMSRNLKISKLEKVNVAQKLTFWQIESLRHFFDGSILKF